MKTTNKRILQDEKSKEMDLLIRTRFIRKVREASQREAGIIRLSRSFRNFVRSVHTVFGTEPGQLPYLYRLANYTIAQLNLLKAEIRHIESGEKHSN